MLFPPLPDAIKLSDIENLQLIIIGYWIPVRLIWPKLALLAYILARLKPRQNMAKLAKCPAILIEQVLNNL